MTSDEFLDILKVFQNERYDKLEGGAKDTFDAIMKIADERDLLKIQVSARETVCNNLEKTLSWVLKECTECEEDLLINSSWLSNVINTIEKALKHDENANV